MPGIVTMTATKFTKHGPSFSGGGNMNAMERWHHDQHRCHEIASEVCRVCHVTMQDLMSRRRNKEAVNARQMYFWIARNKTGASFPHMAEVIDKDHSTAINAIKLSRNRFNESDWIVKLEEALHALGYHHSQGGTNG